MTYTASKQDWFQLVTYSSKNKKKPIKPLVPLLESILSRHPVDDNTLGKEVVYYNSQALGRLAQDKRPTVKVLAYEIILAGIEYAKEAIKTPENYKTTDGYNKICESLDFLTSSTYPHHLNHELYDTLLIGCKYSEEHPNLHAEFLIQATNLYKHDPSITLDNPIEDLLLCMRHPDISPDTRMIIALNLADIHNNPYHQQVLDTIKEITTMPSYLKKPDIDRITHIFDKKTPKAG